MQPSDEECPICQHPVPEEARQAAEPTFVATPAVSGRRRVGRTAVTIAAVFGWLAVTVAVISLVLAWT